MNLSFSSLGRQVTEGDELGSTEQYRTNPLCSAVVCHGLLQLSHPAHFRVCWLCTVSLPDSAHSGQEVLENQFPLEHPLNSDCWEMIIKKEEVTEESSTCPRTRQKNQPVVHTVVTNSVACPHNDDLYSLLSTPCQR